MIDELLKAATSGEAGQARDTVRTLADPALLPEFRSLLSRKLTAVERKLAYEFLEYLSLNSRSPEVAAFLLARLKAEKTEAAQLAILGTLRLLDGLDCGPIEPFLASGKPRVRHAAVQALGACAGDRPAQLVSDILRRSDGGEDVRQCAEALARCGSEASADEVIAKLKTIERSRGNAPAITQLLVAIYGLCGPRHGNWLRGELTKSHDTIDRWLLLLGVCKVGTEDDCALVAAEVEAYLDKPTGPLNLLTGFTPILHRTPFQAGMSFLRRTCPGRLTAVAAQAGASKLPDEDRRFLDSLI